MDTELTVPKWVLIVWPKIPQMPQKITAQAQKFEIFEKALWVSVVHGWHIAKVGYAGWMDGSGYPTLARRKPFIARINLMKAFR